MSLIHRSRSVLIAIVATGAALAFATMPAVALNFLKSPPQGSIAPATSTTTYSVAGCVVSGLGNLPLDVSSPV